MKTQPIQLQDIISKAKIFWSKLTTETKIIEDDEDVAPSASERHEIIDSNHIWSISFIFWFAGAVVVYL
jgi:hypothetical protein